MCEPLFLEPKKKTCVCNNCVPPKQRFPYGIYLGSALNKKKTCLKRLNKNKFWNRKKWLLCVRKSINILLKKKGQLFSDNYFKRKLKSRFQLEVKLKIQNSKLRNSKLKLKKK